MKKADAYRQALRELADWDAYLMQESGLPGPRANLELAQAVADVGNRERFEHLLSYTDEIAQKNSAQEFLALCGVVGLGRLLAEGDERIFDRLRGYASDPRWRMREAVAMALQRLGDVNMERLLQVMEQWATGNWLEKRAAAAALAEPRLLHRENDAVRVLHILDRITETMQGSSDGKSEPFKALEKGLSYCWSVAVAAAPMQGKLLMEKWLSSPDSVIRRIMDENLKKNRLVLMDAAWVEKRQASK